MTGDLDAVFAALADPTRRWLLTRLGQGGARSATNLAGELPMSRQAVVHHLQALDGAGLVDARRAGREVLWSATAGGVGEAVAWLVAASSPPG